MNYFIRGLLQGNKRYWAAMAAMCIWLVAIVDAISTGIRAPGLFNGKWFTVTAILTALAPVVYYIYDFATRSRRQKIMKGVEDVAKAFEPRREQEIRRMVAENPEFTTHCFECVHFNPNLRTCGRRLTEDISKQRIKEIKINNITYCLYWKKA